jgi:hypothetical protein
MNINKKLLLNKAAGTHKLILSNDASNFYLTFDSTLSKKNGLQQYSIFLLTHTTGMRKPMQRISLLTGQDRTDRSREENSPASAKIMRYFLSTLQFINCNDALT